MSAQRPASPELDADDVADVRYPNTARIWNYQLGGKDNFPVDRKASDAANAMVRDISAPTGEDAAHDGRHLLQRMVDYMLGQGLRAATEPEAPWFRVKPLPAYAEAQVAGCQETGMRVVIGCGGCAGSAP
jgi:hypothetical protein